MKVYFSTSGCVSEFTEFQRFLKAIKAEQALYLSEADIIIAHFCGISTESFQKIMPSMAILQGLKENKKFSKAVKVFVGGCASSVIDFKEEFPYVDGTFRRGHLLEDLAQFFDYNPTEYYNIASSYLNVVSIERGCKRKCGFCKQAYMDMEVHSRPIELIKKDIGNVVSNGYKTLTLFAENSTEYGIDLPGKPKLIELLQEVCGIEKIVQITLAGLCMDELACNPELLAFIRDSKKITEIQLEVQSLDPVVRRLMNLSSSLEQVLEVLEQLKTKSIISDIMLGYPGETAEGVQRELNVIKANNLYFLRTIMYDNTPLVYGSTLKQIPKDIAAKHSASVVNCILELRKKQANKMKGLTFQGIKTSDGNIKLLEYYACVDVPNSSNFQEGELVSVRITGLGEVNFMDPAQSFVLKGMVVDTDGK